MRTIVLRHCKAKTAVAHEHCSRFSINNGRTIRRLRMYSHHPLRLTTVGQRYASITDEIRTIFSEAVAKGYNVLSAFNAVECRAGLLFYRYIGSETISYNPEWDSRTLAQLGIKLDDYIYHGNGVYFSTVAGDAAESSTPIP